MNILPTYIHNASLRTQKILLLASLAAGGAVLVKLTPFPMFFAIFLALPVLWLALRSLFFRDHSAFHRAWDRIGAMYATYAFLFFRPTILLLLFIVAIYAELSMS